jgi:hypothetical protein
MATTVTTEVKARTITVPAADWKRWKALKAEASAIEKAAKALEATFPLPAPSEDTQGTWVVVDGNGDEQGKMSVFLYPGAIIPEGWRKRLS